MIRVYTIGHEIPKKIRDCVDKWNDWTWIVAANTPRKNKDAKDLIQKIEQDNEKIAVYKDGDIDIYVSYLFPVK
ncbi:MULTISPECIES: hypothetical protein [Bacillus]|uniref:hypothetical protein n=1 Tax=Bacillus TaxID=1386 RepID=UPI000C787BCF|nr:MULTISPECIES: hypothetical protein [Bacillus]MCY1628370.1 hypothetical protein [Bacillus paralicheniformis]MCY8577545.1 hypothetical protein [Bacillus haynesii]MEC1657108.1 hypothetical protein [Bacillus haynesii]MED4337909.1 hypothetical protein [Bacillus licheniformis]MED4371087.1 hypothetical protein [Bacillus licheniformis]